MCPQGDEAHRQRMRRAACMVRAMRAVCPVPRALPAQSVLGLAAWKLCDELPRALGRRDDKTLASTGLVREHRAALLRSFPSADDAAALDAAFHLILAGLAPGLAPEALRLWGPGEAVTRVSKDPYGCVFALKGGALKDAHALCRGGGPAARVAGHARWALLEAARGAGHTALPTASLVRRIAQAEGLDGEEVREALAAAACRGEIAVAGEDAQELLADPDLAAKELTIARQVLERMRTRPQADDDRDPDWAAAGAAHLTDEQRGAIGVIRVSGISVLTGGPGSGKSTVVRALVEALGPEAVMLTAPTGRAARNVGGDTVHRASGGRLLRRRPLQETSSADVSADVRVFVVDEASMLDLDLAVAVLSLAPPGSRLVLVGDADQLPAVGAGNVFADLVDVVPTTRLRANHRNGQGLQAAAAAVLRGEVPTTGAATGVRLVNATDAASAMRVCVKLNVTKHAQIMTPHNSHRALLNRAVQTARFRVTALARPAATGMGVPSGALCSLRTDATTGMTRLEFAHGSTGAPRHLDMPVDQALSLVAEPGRGRGHALMVGDAVMVLRNQTGGGAGGGGGWRACNGDVGTLASRDLADGSVIVDFGGDGGCTARFADPDQWLTLAYAATVHKFQGSECEAVALPLAGSLYAWDRGLLYTAMTRAKRVVYLVGTPDDLAAVAAKARPPRLSALKVFLRTL